MPDRSDGSCAALPGYYAAESYAARKRSIGGYRSPRTRAAEVSEMLPVPFPARAMANWSEGVSQQRCRHADHPAGGSIVSEPGETARRLRCKRRGCNTAAEPPRDGLDADPLVARRWK